MRIRVYQDRYPTAFIVPRRSRHEIDHQKFLPFDRVNHRLEGAALFPPLGKADLIHAHNRIPLAQKRYIISFESHLPRRFSFPRDNAYTRWLTRDLASSRCRRILAWSHYAKRHFLNQTKDAQEAGALAGKLLVRHPNVELGAESDPISGELASGRMDTLRITFVGGHFARKGGCVAALLAKLAHDERLPLQIQIISDLTMGATVWTDPSAEGALDRYVDYLSLPNVTVFKSLPNNEVRRMLRNSHFGFLPTFSDTFGFSVIEAMAEHTPSVVTCVQALPEFVKSHFNGVLLPLKTDALGDWVKPDYNTRSTRAYEEFFSYEVEMLAGHAINALRPFIETPAKMLPLRRNARRTAELMFSPEVSAAFYDPFYDRIACEPLTSRAQCDALDVSSPTIDDIDFDKGL